MGSQISVTYGSIAHPSAETAALIASLFETQYRGVIRRDFAQVSLSSDTGYFRFHGEVDDLRGRPDLDRRLRALGSGAFSYELDAEFASVDAQVLVFSDESKRRAAQSVDTTAVVNFDKELTSYLFTSEVTRSPFVMFLERIAAAIGAQCFIACVECDRWLPMKPSDLLLSEVFGDAPQVVGWVSGAVDENAVLSALSAQAEWVERSLDGYTLVSLLGRQGLRRKGG